jgi:hypothetical protein
MVVVKRVEGRAISRKRKTIIGQVEIFLGRT